MVIVFTIFPRSYDWDVCNNSLLLIIMIVEIPVFKFFCRLYLIKEFSVFR